MGGEVLKSVQDYGNRVLYICRQKYIQQLYLVPSKHTTVQARRFFPLNLYCLAQLQISVLCDEVALPSMPTQYLGHSNEMTALLQQPTNRSSPIQTMNCVEPLRSIITKKHRHSTLMTRTGNK